MGTTYGIELFGIFISNYILGFLAFVLIAAFCLFAFWQLGGFRELKKIWCDIHLNPATGSYSQKRLAMSFSFFLGWFICFTAAFDIQIWPEQRFNSQPVSIWVPVLLFSVGLGATAATLMGHLNARKTADKNGNPLTPAYTDEPVKQEEIEDLLETTQEEATGIKEPHLSPSFAAKYGYKVKETAK